MLWLRIDILVIAGGERSHEKVKTTAQQTLYGGFMAAYKPVMAVSDAVKLMADLELLQGITVSGPENVKEAATFGGAVWSEFPCDASQPVQWQFY